MNTPIAKDESGFGPEDVTVKISELLVATADESDALIDNSVQEVLHLMRESMKMDVAFVSEFTEGKRVFRYVDTAPGKPAIASGESDPLEESWCKRVVDGRLPQFIADAAQNPASASLEKQSPYRIGTFISTPIVLSGGRIYGTLCCFSHRVLENPDEADLKRLKLTARLTANKIDKSLAALERKHLDLSL
jgi:GAF domain-containing protein